jgi:hypothetical protein
MAVHKLKRVPLTKGKEAVIDAEDFDLVSQFSWHCSTNGYACAREKGRRQDPRKQVWMHRLIAQTPEDMFTDHANGDKLDNRKTNLRLCDKQQNAANSKLRSDNTTGYKGVVKVKSGWRAEIWLNGKHQHIGIYNSIKEAATAYMEAANKHFGEYANGGA